MDFDRMPEFKERMDIARKAKHVREKQNQEEYAADRMAEHLNDLELVCEDGQIQKPKTKWYSSKSWCPHCGKQLEVWVYTKYISFADAKLYHYSCECSYEFARKNIHSFL